MDERKGECQGNQEKCNLTGCPKFGALGRPARDGMRRVKGCSDPTARGKRNRSKGDSKARTRHEEHWGGMFRVEVKAGAQINAIWTRFRDARLQSNASKSLGDIRPFAMIAMPDGTSEGIVLMSLDEFAELCALL